MLKNFSQFLSKYVDLVKNNRQIVYTLFLAVVIIFAFVWNAERFLQTANNTAERVEMAGIGLMQDSFVIAASGKINDDAFLQNAVASLKQMDDRGMISDISVVRMNGGIFGTTTVVASLNKSEIGKPDELDQTAVEQLSGTIRTTSTIVPVQEQGERHWVAYRGILDQSGNMVGYLIADFSMKSFDDQALQEMINSYLSLIVVLIFILFLLFRQARIIDYTVLYQKLKEVDQMKDDFLSMAAHELRTPLTIIRGYVDLLRGEKDPHSPKTAENLQRIDASAAQLVTLVGDILDVSRLEQGRMKFDFAPVDVNETARTSTESFVPIAKEKGLAINCESIDSLPKISADPTRLQQVLVNIIGNAVKYTPSGSVTVKTSFDPLKKTVMIRVSDTGMGISAEDQTRLFGKFYRVKNVETESIQGTGLGLWITNRIVTEMQGTISVESIKGKGTDFIITFPALMVK